MILELLVGIALADIPKEQQAITVDSPKIEVLEPDLYESQSISKRAAFLRDKSIGLLSELEQGCYDVKVSFEDAEEDFISGLVLHFPYEVGEDACKPHRAALDELYPTHISTQGLAIESLAQGKVETAFHFASTDDQHFTFWYNDQTEWQPFSFPSGGVDPFFLALGAKVISFSEQEKYSFTVDRIE
jgi:hypothetical protein